MSVLNREQFLSADDLTHRDVPVPEMGEGAQVRIAVMSGAAREKWELDVMSRQGPDGKLQNLEGMKALALVYCAIDADGARLFTEADVSAINQKNGAVIDRLCDAALEINGLTEKALQEMRGNLNSGQS